MSKCIFNADYTGGSGVTGRDRIYAEKLKNIDAFRFDAEVAQVFPDMINRSVPGYGSLINLTGCLASQYAGSSTNIYDLGCSVGAGSLAMRQFITVENAFLYAVDSSLDMVLKCRENLEAQKSALRFEVLHRDILAMDIANSSLVVMNFVLQFIDPANRLELLSNIYTGLNPGGVLLIAEKTCSVSEINNDNYNLWLEQFKKNNGYSELEIAQKRKALENTLVTDSEQTHRERFRQAGFSRAQKWFQAFGFKAFAVFK